MVIYGIDRQFKLTVGAYKEIARQLPGGNIEELGAVLTSEDPFAIMTMIFNLATVMNRQYELQQSFMDPSYKKNRPLTVEELETLPVGDVLGELKDEVMAAIVASQASEITLKKTSPEAGEESPTV